MSSKGKESEQETGELRGFEMFIYLAIAYVFGVVVFVLTNM